MKTVSGSIEYIKLDIDLTVFMNLELNDESGNGEGTIYLESQSGNILLEGFNLRESKFVFYLIFRI
jgi:hypothetical protein